MPKIDFFEIHFLVVNPPQMIKSHWQSWFRNPICVVSTHYPDQVWGGGGTWGLKPGTSLHRARVKSSFQKLVPPTHDQRKKD